MDAFDALTRLAATRLRVSALAPLVQRYCGRLWEQRYSPNTARQYLNCLAHFAHWSGRPRLDLRAIDQHAADFIDSHLPGCACPAPVQ